MESKNIHDKLVIIESILENAITICEEKRFGRMKNPGLAKEIEIVRFKVHNLKRDIEGRKTLGLKGPISKRDLKQMIGKLEFVEFRLGWVLNICDEKRLGVSNLPGVRSDIETARLSINMLKQEVNKPSAVNSNDIIYQEVKNRKSKNTVGMKKRSSPIRSNDTGEKRSRSSRTMHIRAAGVTARNETGESIQVVINNAIDDAVKFGGYNMSQSWDGKRHWAEIEAGMPTKVPYRGGRYYRAYKYSKMKLEGELEDVGSSSEPEIKVYIIKEEKRIHAGWIPEAEMIKMWGKRYKLKEIRVVGGEYVAPYVYDMDLDEQMMPMISKDEIDESTFFSYDYWESVSKLREPRAYLNKEIKLEWGTLVYFERGVEMYGLEIVVDV